jgi:hypothetical protein
MQSGLEAHDVRLLPQVWGGGDKAAFDRLAPSVYRELRRSQQPEWTPIGNPVHLPGGK